MNIFEYFVNIWGGNIELGNTTHLYFQGWIFFEFLWILIWQDWIWNTLTIRICICRGEYLSKIILNCLNANPGYFQTVWRAQPENFKHFYRIFSNSVSELGVQYTRNHKKMSVEIWNLFNFIHPFWYSRTCLHTYLYVNLYRRLEGGILQTDWISKEIYITPLQTTILPGRHNFGTCYGSILRIE